MKKRANATLNQNSKKFDKKKKKRPCIVVFTTFTDFHQQREHTQNDTMKKV